MRKTISTLLLLGSLGMSGLDQQERHKIKITDASGTSTEIASIDLDYTSYPGVGGVPYRPDHEFEGIRLKQGEGQLTVPWTHVAALTVRPQPVFWLVQRDGTRREFAEAEKDQWDLARRQREGPTGSRSWGQDFTFTGELQLVSGVTRSVEIVPVSRDVRGESDLGNYTIALSDVREIRPVR